MTKHDLPAEMDTTYSMTSLTVTIPGALDRLLTPNRGHGGREVFRGR